jgi:hypothetical protein
MNIILLKIIFSDDKLKIILEHKLKELSARKITFDSNYNIFYATYINNNIFYRTYINNNIEFNKYIIELIKNTENRYFVISTFFQPNFNSFELPKYLEVFYYYIKIQNLENNIKIFNIEIKINLFVKMFNKYCFTFDELIKLKDFMNISDIDFISNILFNLKNKKINYYPLIIELCISNNTILFEDITKYYKNTFTVILMSNKHCIIETIFLQIVINKKINFIKIFYNYLKSINIMNKILLTNILDVIIKYLIKNNYKKIIYDFLNLGAEIKKKESKYKIYHKYSHKIKF